MGHSQLNVSKLSIKFGGLLAVSDFNFNLPAGALYGLIGPNGAGKTTVFNLLTGVYEPDSGPIQLGSRNLVGVPAYKIAQAGVSRTFQNIRLFSTMTVLENVLVSYHRVRAYGFLDWFQQN